MRKFTHYSYFMNNNTSNPMAHAIKIPADLSVSKQNQNNDPVSDTHLSDHSSSLGHVPSVSVPANWLGIKNGKFECSECENENVPETNTAEGVIEADIEQIKEKFIENPGKKLTIYGICPICGMEYEFRFSNDTLYLEPSSMTK